ncbi:N-acetylneuraminate synthase family protein [Schumannella sp. 10F1B-5-1]|uniref:N-acetylneuraminate synthase family protein n=1 Tax=Schumannella sp. 10F1B-5-1 TaxID=2590780 RepID=UPI0011304ADF|nr:N-acetylneuraminate synthase family protein [Schumannella sp. 10F1B-5-1]TPW73547.1 N-acetylneuraminate synthase [Schumannella sp. 10F1B-5-1]
MTFTIGTRTVSHDSPTYFIADIAASHDGDLGRAVQLIELAAEAGADAAKFQNFHAEQIVSDRGFRELGTQIGHQAAWERSVVDVYADASIPDEWTPTLKEACDRAGIDYFSAPYDFGAIDMLDPWVPAYKIGSGDLSWLEAVDRIASKGKPVLLATGASSFDEVVAAIDVIRRHTSDIVLMQCNTNYTGDLGNFSHIHLNVLNSYRAAFPDVVLGLSDHTPGHATTLGAIALGARVVEKHFTDDTTRPGPDHGFSMDPETWREMVDRSRELELALGSPVKRVADNEHDTVVIQRRALRVIRNLPAGHVLTRDDISVLRPAPRHAIGAAHVDEVVGRVLASELTRDAVIGWEDLTPAR